MKIFLALTFLLLTTNVSANIEKENLRQPVKAWKEYKKEGYKSFGCSIETRWFTGWDPVRNQPSSREIHIFRPDNPRQARPLILLPPTGGVNILDQRMGKYFCRHNVTLYVLAKFDGYADKGFELTRHDHQIRANTAALRELIQWINEPVNLMGASLGALYAAAAAGSDPQIKKVVLVVGGIDLAGILTDSELDSVTIQKINRKKIHQLASDQEYLQLMKKSIFYDPGIFLDEEKLSSRYLLYISTNDDGVPTKYQNQLANLLPEAKKIYYKSGHLMTIARTYLFQRDEIFNFLNKD